MRILTTKGEFNLPPDFTAEYMQNNVMLTDSGEQTLPFNLPPDANNLKLLGYGNRLDSLYKPITDMEVQVIDGLFSRVCNMGIHKANEDEISCTLYFDSGSFFSLIDKMMMSQLPLKVITGNGTTLEQRVESLINILKSQYINPSSASDFDISPVLTTQSYTWRVSKQGSGAAYDTDITGIFTLNGFDRYIAEIGSERPQSPEPITEFEAQYTQRLVEGGNVINIAKGYGMTPFIRLKYLLHVIFNHFGYTFNDGNLQNEIIEYPNICILNNVADAIYSGVLYYKDLVPEMSVKDFLAEVKKYFAGCFVFNEVNKTVTFHFFDEVLSYPADIDLTPYMSSSPKNDEPQFINLILALENQKKIDLPDNKYDNEEIRFNFLTQKTVVQEHKITARGYKDVTFRMLQIEGIVHKYSHIEIDGENKEEKTSSDKNVIFAYIDNTEHISVTTADVFAYYYTTHEMFHLSLNYYRDQLALMKALYSTYKSFREKSNIPVTVRMNIPQIILNKLNMTRAKNVNGQNLLIETINQVLGDSAEQEIVFRTVRNYNERT